MMIIREHIVTKEIIEELQILLNEEFCSDDIGIITDACEEFHKKFVKLLYHERPNPTSLWVVGKVYMNAAEAVLAKRVSAIKGEENG